MDFSAKIGEAADRPFVLLLRRGAGRAEYETAAGRFPVERGAPVPLVTRRLTQGRDGRVVCPHRIPNAVVFKAANV